MNNFIIRNLTLIRKLVWLISLTPLALIVSDVIYDQLGANPVEKIERHLGLWTLIFICITLSITPIVTYSKMNSLNVFRRTFGLYSFFYASLHLLAYVWVDYMFDWNAIWHDLYKHRYVYIGFTAWLMMLPLASTSNKKMIVRLKQNWKRLHRLVYLIAIFALLHFFWLTKKDYSEPWFYTAIIALLMLLRISIIKRYLLAKIARIKIAKIW